MTAAPYPADTRAKGWRFELDYEQIEQSSTWALAAAKSPEARGWLLVMWLAAWKQVPCGSFPADEQVIAAMLGIPDKTWAKLRGVLMRGWEQADDGRVYHETITTRVREMLDYRDKAKVRKQEYRERARESQGSPPVVPRDRQGDTTRDTTGKNDTGTGTGTILSEAKASGGLSPPTDRDVVFANGLTLLAAAGVPDKQARSFLGMQCKAHGDKAVRDALERCAKEAPVQPVPWLQAALKTNGRPSVNRAQAVEDENRRVALAWVQGQGVAS